MTPDEAAVLATLATNRRGLTTTGIAIQLQWYRQSTIREFKRNPDEYRAYRTLLKLVRQRRVTQTMTGAGSRYKISNQETLSKSP